MNPITREEQYLNRLTGEEGIIPDKPVTREEQYFARLCGGDNVIPDKPVTRREQYLATLCGEDVITPTKPVTRIEQYMAFASGESESKPEKPITREEMYWDKYQGGDVPEEKTIAFTDIITVTDALARPAVDLQSEITATQNLNGYEYPWVGGAGKNKLEVTATTQTINGVTFTINSDGTISLSGTATATTILFVDSGKVYPSGSYILNGCPSGGGNSTYKLDIPNASYATDSGNGVTFNSDGTTGLAVRMVIYSGYGNNLTFKPMVRLATESNADFAPYENICPISGRTEVNVTRTGVNVWDEETEYGYYSSQNGQPVYVNNQLRSKNHISVKPNTSYLFNKSVNLGDILFYDANKSFISAILNLTPNYVFTTPENCYYINFNFGAKYGGTYNNDVSINYPSTATAHEPYEGDTFNTELGRTVYGGTLDLTTGELTITHAYVDLGDLNWSKFADYNVFEATINDKKNGATNFITTSYRTVEKAFTVLENGETTSTNRFPVPSIFIKDGRVITPQDFKTLVTGQKMVYELATPQTISLTPTEVQMLENNNTIWADAGRVQLTYLSRAAEKVQLMNASLKANTLKLTRGAIKE